LKSRDVFSEKSEKEGCHVYRLRKQSVIERHVIFFLKFGGKSVGEAAPPLYFYMKRDWERVVVVSYSDILARSHANDFRRVVNDPLYRATFPTMWLDRDTDREIATTKRGKRIATSSTGRSPGSGET
jgi:hypothetical protein